MSVPSVIVTELDGQVGTLPVGTRTLVVVGDASSGTANVPAAFARTADVIAAFTSGRMVEAACRAIQLYNIPVVCVKSGSTTAASSTPVVSTNAGTSVISAGADTSADDDYEAYIVFVTGGTVGTAGITYQWSLDGGRTLSPVTALGTANTIVIPNSGGIGIALAAGTIVAGATATWRTTAPVYNATDIANACAALNNFNSFFDVVSFVGAIDGSLFDAIATGMAATNLAGKTWIAHFRIPNIGESEAAYKTAFDTAFGSKSTITGAVASGACESVSAISGRQYLRPSSFESAALVASVSEEIDVADPNLGSLRGVSISDVNGNPKHHDERLFPGLDDSRSMTLRTFDGIQGVFINNPRLLSPAGSDFEFIQHRRVMNLARAALISYFQRRLSQPILVNATTGFILEREARDIEAGADAVLAGVLLTKPKASDAACKLARNDNILSTKQLRAQAFIVPLAYPKVINLTLGFRNPVLQQVNS